MSRRRNKRLPSRIIQINGVQLRLRKTEDGFWVAKNAIRNIKSNDLIFVGLSLAELISQLRLHRSQVRERLRAAIRNPKGRRRQREAEEILRMAELSDTEENRARAIYFLEQTGSYKEAAFMLRSEDQTRQSHVKTTQT